MGNTKDFGGNIWISFGIGFDGILLLLRGNFQFLPKGPDLFPTLLAGDDGIVVTTEITLGRHCPGPSLSLAGPVLGWADLLIVRLQTSPGGELEINLIN